MPVKNNNVKLVALLPYDQVWNKLNLFKSTPSVWSLLLLQVDNLSVILYLRQLTFAPLSTRTNIEKHIIRVNPKLRLN